MEPRIPIPPFTQETAFLKVQIAEATWSTRNPQYVAMAYTDDTECRNRSAFVNGRAEVISFLTKKWITELDYKLKKGIIGLYRRPDSCQIRM